MLLFSTVLDVNETLTKEAFIQLVIEWNQNSKYESNAAYYGDGRYLITFPKTPSDNRTGKNLTSEIINICF